MECVLQGSWPLCAFNKQRPKDRSKFSPDVRQEGFAVPKMSQESLPLS